MGLTAWADEATFEFTTRAGVAAMGLTAPGSDSYIWFRSAVTVDGVTVTPNTNFIRITNDDEGDMYLHMLSTAANGIQKFTISVDEGKAIKAIKFKYTTPAQVDKIAFDSGTFYDEYVSTGNRYAEYCNWSGDAPAVEVSTIGAGTIAGTQKTYTLLIDNFVVTYEDAAPTGIETVNAGQAVKSVRYYNLLGVESAEPFQGVNVVVTTYTDGTRSAKKVIK